MEKSISLGGWWKKVAFPSPLVWPRFTIHPLIHPSPVSLSLYSDVPKACSCLWEADVLLGIMAKCHIFLSIYILFFGLHGTLPIYLFGSLCMESMWVCLLCLCVCVLNPDHAVCLRTLLPHQLHQTPPAVAFGRNTEQGWEGCSVPTFGLSHSQRNKPSPKHTLNTCSVLLHCLICIWAQVVH